MSKSPTQVTEIQVISFTELGFTAAPAERNEILDCAKESAQKKRQIDEYQKVEGNRKALKSNKEKKYCIDISQERRESNFSNSLVVGDVHSFPATYIEKLYGEVQKNRHLDAHAKPNVISSLIILAYLFVSEVTSHTAKFLTNNTETIHVS